MMFDDLTLARIIHSVAIIGWIGGVWFVTFVVMPAIRREPEPDNRLSAFHRIEAGFAPQARLWVALAGASGFWMTARAGLWARFADQHFWWMHAMLALWTIFALMLFVIEPLFLHKRMMMSETPADDFRRMEWAHRLLSTLGLVTVAGAMGGAHGFF